MRMPIATSAIVALMLTQACGSKSFKSSNDEQTPAPIPEITANVTDQDANEVSPTDTEVVGESNPTDSVNNEVVSTEGKNGEEPGPVKPDECTVRVLNFDQDPEGNAILPGTIITEQYAAWGVSIDVSNAVRDRADIATIFDSNNPTGDDEDLRTPSNMDAFGNDTDLGNLLIISENDKLNSDGRIAVPDDNKEGGKIYFNFSEETVVLSLLMIDIDEDGSYAKTKDADGNTVEKVEASDKGNNSVQKLDFAGENSVSSLKVKIRGSGAVDQVTICVGEQGPGKDDDNDNDNGGKK